MAFLPQQLAPSPTTTTSPAGIANPAQASATPLSIGAVTFRSEECPSHIELGSGEQKLVVTEFIGGGRVVASLGPQPKPVTWSGGFFEGNVQGRVSALRAYMAAGQEIFISWLDEQYYCKIKDFTPDYKNQYWCPYTITIEITRDANGAFSSTSAPSLDSQVAGLQSDANNANVAMIANDPLGTAALQPYLANVNLQIQNAGPLAQTAGTTAPQILQATEAALNAVNAYAFTVSPTSAQFLPTTQLQNALGLIYRNIQAGQSPSTVRVQGTSTWVMASQYYGDITQSFALAKTNALVTSRIPNAVTALVTLPPYAA